MSGFIVGDYVEILGYELAIEEAKSLASDQIEELRAQITARNNRIELMNK